MSKADKLLAILWLLQSRKRMTASQIAEELEISVRTVYRYMDTLCMSGVPVVSEPGHDGGYSLLNDFVAAPLFFNTDERKAIMHAALFARQAGYPFGEALESALGKMKLHANEEQLNELIRHTQGFDVVETTSARRSIPGVLQLIEQAVADSHMLRIKYVKSGETVSQTRDIDPYGLVYWRGKWYVVAYCRFRGEMRNFRVDRIAEATLAGSVFQRPDGFSAGDAFMQSLVSDAVEQEQLVSIRVQGHPEAVSHLCEHWFLCHALIERGAEEAHFKVADHALLTYLPQILLPYGKSVRVLEPDELKDGLEAAALELLRHYQGRPS